MTTARITRREILKTAVTMAGVAAFPRVLRAQAAPIKVGVVSPVTGAMAEVGGDCRLGAQMAADAINSRQPSSRIRRKTLIKSASHCENLWRLSKKWW